MCMNVHRKPLILLVSDVDQGVPHGDLLVSLFWNIVGFWSSDWRKVENISDQPGDIAPRYLRASTHTRLLLSTSWPMSSIP